MFAVLWMAFELLCRMIVRALSLSQVPREIAMVVCGLCWMKLRRAMLIDSTWFFYFFGGASGDFWTVYFNCMCQMVYWWIVWCELTGQVDFELFKQHLVQYWTSLGDDCILQIPPVLRDTFTSEAIVATMWKACGQVITGSGDKGELVYDGSVDFLKRQFRIEGERVFAYLSPAVVYKAFMFMPRIDVNPRLRWVGMLESMWCESLIMPDEWRDEVQKFLVYASRVLGYEFRKMTFSEFVVKFDEGSFLPW